MVKAKELFHHFIGLFYPNMCSACGENLTIGEEVICLKCLYHLPRTNLHLERENKIEKRFWGKVNIECATSFYYFEKGSDFQKILHKLKYKDGKEIGFTMGKYAGSELLDSPDFQQFDFIVPVPLHPKKMAKRGYNQAEWIAHGLSEVMNVPVETTNLFRAIENPTQTKKSVYERWENTKGIFDIHNLELFENKRVLIVDDVLTTGATLIACAEAILEKCPTAKISVFTLAVA